MPDPKPGQIWRNRHTGTRTEIVLVAGSLDAAVVAVKDTYGPPYVVEWGELEKVNDQRWYFVGDFEAVRGKSTKHSAGFSVTSFDLVAADRRENT